MRTAPLFWHDLATRWVDNISQGTLTQEEVFIAYFPMFRPSITHPLAVTFFTKQQSCQELQAKLTGPFLSYMGSPKTATHSIIFCLASYSGSSCLNI